MASNETNKLLSTQKSESGLRVALHPLVLLTISDYLTRHTLRNQKGPIVGALLGQQNGHETSVEHAFECKMDGDLLDGDWFAKRLQQMKDVHKAPVLDLVGWYALTPISGPQQQHVSIQSQLAAHGYSESTILLGFHPTAVLEGSIGGKLPLTIYEAIVDSAEVGREDVEMGDTPSRTRVTFSELPYSVETGEAEMIGIDFVAKGGGNATAVEIQKKPAPAIDAKTSKGKKRTAQGSDALDADTNRIEEQHIMSREDEELIASLTAKVNAIKMLQSRIHLITTYLEKLPPSYISRETSEAILGTNPNYTPVNHMILRSVQAMLSRLALLIPSDRMAFSQELLAEQNDVNLVNLLSSLTQSIQDSRDVGRKLAIVEQSKQNARKGGKSDFFAALDPSQSPARDFGRTGAGDFLS